MLKAILTSLVIIFIVTGCFRDYQVDNSDNDFAIELKIEKLNDGIKLNWSPVKNSAFKKYVIVSSQSDFQVGKTPVAFQIIKEIFDQNQNFYVDQTISLSTLKYYKVYVEIGDRFLESNSELLKSEIFEMVGRSSIFAFDRDSLELFLGASNSTGIVQFDLKSNLNVSQNLQLNNSFSSLTTVPYVFLNKPTRRLLLFNRSSTEVINLPGLSSSSSTLLNATIIFSAVANEKAMVITYNNGGSATAGQVVFDINNNFTNKKTYNRDFPLDNRILGITQNGNIIEVAAGYGYSYNVNNIDFVSNFKKYTFSKAKPVLPKMIMSKDKTLFIASTSGDIYNQNFELVLERNCSNCATFAISDDKQFLYEATKRNSNGISEIRKYNIKENKLIKTVELRDNIIILELHPDGNKLGVFYDRLSTRINYQKIDL